MEKEKVLGQYMTPDNIVKIILDEVGYIGEDILHKKIFEPSFGTGQFLIEILERLTNECKKKNYTKDQIKEIIQNNIYGIEKDAALYDICINRLNDYMAHIGVLDVKWDNLTLGDTTTLYGQYKGVMDYVVGNPPYVRIRNIDKEYRDILKQFSFSQGMIDLYVIFYEIGISLLNEQGKLGYITPNSFLKNTSTKIFRSFLNQNRYIDTIYDFKNTKIFDKADTYTCICIINKKEKDCLNYISNNQTTPIPYTYIEFLKDNPWEFGDINDINFLLEIKNRKKKIKDIAIIQNGLATNCNKAYIHKFYKDKDLSIPYNDNQDGEYVYFQDMNDNIQKIEKTILRRCIKESKYEGVMDNTYIIFPYKKDNDKIIAMEESELQQYPYAYQYFLSIKDILINRDMDKNINWYEYGRSQGIQNSQYSKVIFKHIIKDDDTQITPYIVSPDILIYAGIFATTRNGNIENIYNTYKTEEFSKYIKLTGKDVSGGYKTISTKAIQNYGIE